jgi:arginase
MPLRFADSAKRPNAAAVRGFGHLAKMPVVTTENSRLRPGDLSLLLPEWQGYGMDSTVADAARALAGAFPSGAFVEVDAPLAEPLALEDGVLGLSAITRQAQRTLDAINPRQPSRIFTIAGTCGAELGPVAYLNARYRGDLAVVWLDAHGDLNTPETSPSAHFHGMVLRTLLGAGPDGLVRLLPRRLGANQIILAGVRDLDRDEILFASDAAVTRLAPSDLLVPDRVSGRVRAAGFTKVYVHLDLDVLDPVEFPDSLMQTPGGPTVDQVVDTICHLDATFDVVGFSVVEFRMRTANAVARVERLIARCGIDIGAAGTR